MPDEIDADFAPVDAPAQTANGEFRVRKHARVSLLYDEPFEEAKAAATPGDALLPWDCSYC